MAVVTQPFDRGAVCTAPSKPQADLGEFWEEDPWKIAFKHNLSDLGEKHKQRRDKYELALKLLDLP